MRLFEMPYRLHQTEGDDYNAGIGDAGGEGGGGGGFEPPPVEPFPPPSEPIPLPPPTYPTDPYPIEPTPTPIQPIEPISGGEPPTAPTEPGPVYPIPPGQPGSPENPFSGEGTTHPPTEKQPGQSTPSQPVQFGPPVTSQQPGTSGGGGNVQVIVNNYEQIANDVLNQIAQAVKKGLTDGMNAVSDVAQTLFGKIGDILKQIGQTLWDTLKQVASAIASQLGSLLSGIAGALKSAAQTIFEGIKAAMGDIRDTLRAVIDKVAPILDSIAKQVQTINDTLIKPIATFINTTVKTIADLTTAIERDLHDGLSGILKIPGDIAQGLGSLDASLQRTVQELGTVNKATVDSVLTTTDGKNLAAHLQSVGDAITQGTGFHQIASTFTPKPIALTDENFNQISRQLSNSVTPLIKEIMSSMFTEMSTWMTSYEDTFKAPAPTPGIVGAAESVGADLLNKAVDLIKSFITAFLSAAIGFAVAGAELEVAIEYAGERARKAVPITKLDPDLAVQAWQRGFITDEALNDELLSKGLDSTRQSVYKDMSVFLAPQDQALDWWYRGVINDDDLADNFKRHGILTRDIDAFKEGSQQLIQPADAILAWKRGIITEDQLQDVLKRNRFTDNDSVLVKALSVRPRGTLETIADATHILAGQETDIFSFLNTQAPQSIMDAGTAEGLDNSVTNFLWRNHWSVPGIQTWVTLYFRGLRTKTELQAALDYHAVPREMQDDVIEVFRPLIPFRSIPNYVRAGLLSESQGRDALAGHGFDIGTINTIMKAAQQGSTKKASTAAASIATLSIANAKTLFEDGAIDQSQYEQVLEAHGYTAELAQAQAQVDIISLHARQRRQELADYSNQVQAGVTSMDDAIAALSKYGFTTAEIQSWQAKVLKSQKSAQKHPSLSELDKFWKASLITIEQYKAELEAQGWTDPWLSAFVALVTPSAAQ